MGAEIALKTISDMWWCAIALARLKRQGLCNEICWNICQPKWKYFIQNSLK